MIWGEPKAAAHLAAADASCRRSPKLIFLVCAGGPRHLHPAAASTRSFSRSRPRWRRGDLVDHRPSRSRREDIPSPDVDGWRSELLDARCAAVRASSRSTADAAGDRRRDHGRAPGPAQTLHVSRTVVARGRRLPRADVRPARAALLRARAARADGAADRRPPLAQAGALRGAGPGGDECVPLLRGRRQGGSRGRGRANPCRRDRAGLVPVHVPRRARASTSRFSSAISTAASSNGCSSATRARWRRWSRRSPATPASAHAWAYCAAIEALAGVRRCDLETEVARAVALELERVAMHLAGLVGARGRRRLSSGRVDLRPPAHDRDQHDDAALRQPLRPRRDASPAASAWPLDARRSMARGDRRRTSSCFATDVADHQRLLPRRTTVQHRLQGVGVLTDERRAASSGSWGSRRAPRAWSRSRCAAPAGRLRRAPIKRACDRRRLLGARPPPDRRDRRLARLARPWSATTYPAWAPRTRVVGAIGALAARRSRWSRAGAARSCTASRPDDAGGARPLQGPGSVAAQLDGPRARGARQRDLRLPDLQQELRSLLLRERPMSVQVAARSRVSRARSTSPTSATARPTGFRGLPVIAPAPCASGLRRVSRRVPDRRDPPRSAVASISAGASSAASASMACPGGEDRVHRPSRGWAPRARGSSS